MGRSRITGISAALGAALALAAPAAAAAQTTEPVKTTYFFKCDGPSKVQNPTLLSGARSWTTTKPTTSFTAGGGCGWADAPVRGTNSENIYDAIFGGSHGGAVASVKIELHNLLLGRITENVFVNQIGVRLAANGVDVVPYTLVPIKPELSSTGLTQKVVAEIKGLNVAKGSSSKPWILTIDSPAGAWVMDASEVPASIEFTEPKPVVAPAAATSKAAKRARARRAAR